MRICRILIGCLFFVVVGCNPPPQRTLKSIEEEAKKVEGQIQRELQNK